MSFDVATLSRNGGRPVNEDDADVLQVEGAACWVVADGLGGHRGGEDASRTAVAAALASFRERPEITTDAVRLHILRAHEAIVRRQQENPLLAQMRSTIVVLAASDRAAVWGHIGDSRLYYLQNGRLAARTRDHSVSQALVDAGEVDARDHGKHEDRSRLLRCLGKEDGAEPTLHGVQSLTRGDDFLLCTDGFWEPLSDDEIAIDACGSGDAAAWLARLEARLTRSLTGPEDNYTASAIRVTTADLPEPPPHDPHAPPPRPMVAAAEPPAGTAPAGPVGPIALRATAVVLGILGLALIGAWVWPATIARLTPGRLQTAPAPISKPAPTPSPSTAPVVATPSDGAPAAMAPPVVPSAPAVAIDSPAAVPEQRIHRPATRETYRSLDAAVAAAADGETLWIGPGTFTGAVKPITKSLHLKGAGRDRTHLDFTGERGLELAAAAGGLEDVDLCCATRSAVLVVRGTFTGRIVRTRIRGGRDYGVRIADTAAPTLEHNDITDNRAGKIVVGPDASPQLR